MTYHKLVAALVTVVALLAMMGGCSHGVDNSQLTRVDSMLAQNRGEEALQMLQTFNIASFDHHNKAYFDLLMAQTDHACNITAISDSAIIRPAMLCEASGAIGREKRKKP